MLLRSYWHNKTIAMARVTKGMLLCTEVGSSLEQERLVAD
jgi:hypothetical protein